MLFRLLSIVTCLAAASSAAAYDSVYAARKLSDDEFYRVAACNAQAGGTCRAPLVKWPARTAQGLSIALKVSGGAANNSAKIDEIRSALGSAISEINSAGAGVRLTIVPKSSAKIVVEIVTPQEMAKYVRRSGSSSAGDQGAVGYNTIWWDNSNAIKKGEVKISVAISSQDVRSVVLEEIFQALGFATDIDGAPYNGRSILAESSNNVVTISGQDRMLLLRHYPR